MEEKSNSGSADWDVEEFESIQDQGYYLEATNEPIPVEPREEEAYPGGNAQNLFMSNVNGNDVPKAFFSKKQLSSKPLKPEYLRCKMIRGHKKFNRFMASNRLPRNGPNQYSTKKQGCWQMCCQIYKQHEERLRNMARTEAGPRTDGRSRRLYSPENLPKTCNNRFCRWYFSEDGVLVSFQAYVDYLFFQETPLTLCEKFKAYCCIYDNHDADCEEKWRQLHRYLKCEMISTLFN